MNNDMRGVKHLKVCQNPDCPKPNGEFEIDTKHRDQKYCSPSCASIAARGRPRSVELPSSAQTIEQDIKILKQLAPGIIEHGGSVIVINVPVQINTVNMSDGKGTHPQIDISDLGLCTIQEATRQLINLALERTNGNRTQAADALGVTPRTIRNWLRDDKALPAPDEPDDDEGELWDILGGGE